MSDNGHDSTAASDTPVRLTVWLTGQVQGVGMRWWVRSRALELGLVGSASNRPDGRVEVVAEGSRGAAEALLALLVPTATAPPGTGQGASAAPLPRPGDVVSAVPRWDSPHGGLVGFHER